MVDVVAAVVADDQIQIQVCYATPNAATLIPLTISKDACIADVLSFSAISVAHPEIDLANCRFGVFGKLKQAGDTLHAGDRLEIYRPLTADPKDARRRRVHKERVASGTETGKF
jgi:uncharacterized protein